ncbi:MAG: membrane protein insertion efficiency factor YidD [Planctomycetales bacterium]
MAEGTGFKWLGRWLRAIARWPARGLIALVRVYQFLLSPLLGKQCRFVPSCSQYFILAVEKYGTLRGSAKGVWRILRCHPWHPGGYDPP